MAPGTSRQCPVCKTSAIDEESFRVIPIVQGGAYSDFLLQRGISSQTYHRCNSCFWIVVRPSLPRDFFRDLYSSVLPVHPHGFRNYEALNEGKVTQTLSRNEAILTYVESIIDKRDYAEIGCPYQGLLPILSSKQLTNPSPLSITHLGWSEPEYWGEKCYIQSTQCKTTLPTSIQSLKLDKNLRSRPYSLLGLFNYLDHTQEPLELLSLAKSIATNVLVVAHEPNLSGPQHRFMLDRMTITKSFEDYGDVIFFDMSARYAGYIVALATSNQQSPLSSSPRSV